MKPEIIHKLEQQRLALQAALDAQKSQAERNRLGQFSTPPALAKELLQYAGELLPAGEPIRFLDPAIGTGSFYAALRALYPTGRLAEAAGFEIDPHYARPTAALWRNTGLTLTLDDFTRREPDPRFNLLICNPPYVRHHHLASEEKGRLQQRSARISGSRIGGLAGLYCHFLVQSHAWMEDGAVAGWLIPSEFMDVNYGAAVKRYLLKEVTLLHIHRFDPADTQFADALVSSAVVWLRKTPPSNDHKVTFTFGGSLSEPRLTRTVPADALTREPKWTRFPSANIRTRSTLPVLADFFRVKRGLVTGDNNYFILPESVIATRGLPVEVFRPILPSPRYVKYDNIDADARGMPCLSRRLFLLDVRLSEDEIRSRFPALWRYLEEGRAKDLHKRYLCRHRTPWYSQEHRPAAPIVCTYFGRGDTKNGRPFRFIRNRSQATVANVYLAMYPTPPVAIAFARDPTLVDHIWEALNRITPDQLLGEGRVYGGGLHKLEPRELANVSVPEVASKLALLVTPVKQEELFSWIDAEQGESMA